MGRIRKLNLSAINIVQHPHSAKKYIELFEEINKTPKIVPIFGSFKGLISNIEINKSEGYIFVKFFRFTDINPNSPWLNTNNKNQVVDQDGNAVQLVEEHFKPNSKEIYFYFVIKNHRLVFDTKLITARSMKSFLENLIKGTTFTNINKEDVKVTIEQSAESLEEILQLYHISKIDLLINRPNPDDLSQSFENSVKKRLENMEASSYEQVVKSDSVGIKPDKELKDYMTVARSNGQVDVKGIDEHGNTKTESTANHPFEAKLSYNDDEETYLEALKNRTFLVVNKIMDGLNK